MKAEMEKYLISFIMKKSLSNKHVQCILSLLYNKISLQYEFIRHLFTYGLKFKIILLNWLYWTLAYTNCLL